MNEVIMPSCFQETTRKARLRHRCCECKGVIEPGENYLYSSGVWDGDAMDYHTCADCEAIRYKHPDREEIGIGYLVEYILESEDVELCERMIPICDRRSAWQTAALLRREVNSWRDA